MENSRKFEGGASARLDGLRVLTGCKCFFAAKSELEYVDVDL